MIQFGTDGIRGPAGEFPCTIEVAFQIGRCAVKLCDADSAKTVLVARDTRESGQAFEAALLAGIAAAGGHGIAVGVLPTAGLMTNVRSGTGEVGVMITASHNPACDNGFKVIGPGGNKLSDAATQSFERWLARADETTHLGTVSQNPLTARNVYFDELAEACPNPASLHGAKIAVDFSNGAGLMCAKWLVDRYPGVEWVFLNQGDGLINDGVGTEHPEGLCEAVVQNACTAGFALDGDADRCVMVDETGTLISGDGLAWFLAKSMGIDAIAVTIMSNAALESLLTGVQVIRTDVGDKHLARAMAADGLALGCEESGHVLFSDGLAGGDGILTGLRTLAFALKNHEPLSSQMSPFKAMPRVKGKVAVNEKPALSGFPEIEHFVLSAPERLGGGRVLLRYSGTEPVIRILVEGQDEGLTRAVYDESVSLIDEVLG